MPVLHGGLSGPRCFVVNDCIKPKAPNRKNPRDLTEALELHLAAALEHLRVAVRRETEGVPKSHGGLSDSV